MRTFYDESELDTVEDGEFVKMHLELEEDLKKEMGIFKKYDKIEEKEEDCFEEVSNKNYTPLESNCKSEIHINPENKIIYVCPKTAQYFLASSSKCCGPINVKYIGHGFNQKFKKVNGDLGTYFILNSGILFIPNERLRPGEIDVLPFEAFDGCNKFKFDVVFTFDPCKCCKK